MGFDKDHDDAVRALGGKVPERPKWEREFVRRLDTMEAKDAEIERLRAALTEALSLMDAGGERMQNEAFRIRQALTAAI